MTKTDVKKKSIWWALCAAYWYWIIAKLPIFTFGWDACWRHGFNLRAVYNDDPMLLDDEDDARYAVEEDISCWSE